MDETNILDEFNFSEEIMNQRISEDNIEDVVSYIQNKVGTGYEITYELVNGEYVIKANDEDLCILNGNNTIGQVVSSFESVGTITEESTFQQSYGGTGGATQPQSPRSGGNRNAPRNNNQSSMISLNIYNAYQIMNLYNQSASKLGDYNNYMSRTYITEKLRNYYNNLGDTSGIMFSALESYLTSFAGVIGNCVSMYLSKDEKDYAELESICNELWGSLEQYHTSTKSQINEQERMMTMMTFENLTPEECIELIENSDEYFEQFYDIIMDDFRVKMEMQKQVFLNKTIPAVLDIIVESQYSANGGDMPLDEYKNMCAQKILSHYGFNKIDEVNGKIDDYGISAISWANEESTAYDKSLLLISYAEAGDIDSIADIFERDVFGNRIVYERGFNQLREASNLFKISDKPAENITKYRNYLTYISGDHSLFGQSTMYDGIDFINDIGIITRFTTTLDFNQTFLSSGIDYGGEFINTAWFNSLKEFGFDSEVLQTYENNTENIFNETFNNTFFAGIYDKYGEEGVRRLVNIYCENLGIDPLNNTDELITQYARQRKADLIFTDFASSTYNSLINDTMLVNNAKKNFKYAVAQALDTSDVTNEQLNDASDVDGWDYLEPWQQNYLAKMYDFYDKDLNTTIYSFVGDVAVNRLEYKGDGSNGINYGRYYNLDGNSNVDIFIDSTNNLALKCGSEEFESFVNSGELKKVFGAPENSHYEYTKSDNGYDVYATNANGMKIKLCSFTLNEGLGMYMMDGDLYQFKQRDIRVHKTNEPLELFDDFVNSKIGEERAIEIIDKATNSDRNTTIPGLIANAAMDLLGVNEETQDDIHTALVGVPLMAALGLGQGIYGSMEGVCNFLAADGKMTADNYQNMYIMSMLSEDKSLYTAYLDENNARHEEVLYYLSTDFPVVEQLTTSGEEGNISTPKYEIKYNGGVIELTEEQYLNYQAKDTKLYEILYNKGKLSHQDYMMYCNLDSRKDNQSYIETLSNLDSRLGGAGDDILALDYNLGSSVGNMVIPLALSVANPALMSAWTFLSVSGNTREQYLQSGKDNNFATFAESCCIGLAAVLSEKFLGRIHGYSEHAGEMLSIFGTPKTKAGYFLATMLSDAIGEVNEELFENVVDYGIEAIFGDGLPTLDEFTTETIQTAYMTFLSTPFINFLGAGMRGQNYYDTATFNYKGQNNIDGYNATYSQAELMQFYNQNGTFDKAGFFRFLCENNRFTNRLLNIDTLLGESYADPFMELVGRIDKQDLINSTNARLKSIGAEVVAEENGVYKVRTKYGQEIAISREGLTSQNLEAEVLQMNQEYERLLVADYFGYMASYDLIEQACAEVGISPGEYIRLSTTPSYKYTQEEFETKLKVERILLKRYVYLDGEKGAELNGHIREGTRIGKVLTKEAIGLPYYSEGATISLGGDIGLYDDISAFIPIPNTAQGVGPNQELVVDPNLANMLFNLYGLDYDGQTFTSDGGSTFEMYYVVGEALEGAAAATHLRFSSAVEIKPQTNDSGDVVIDEKTGKPKSSFSQDAYLEAIRQRSELVAQVAETAGMAPRGDVIMNTDVEYNSPTNPDLANLITQNKIGNIGAHEFTTWHNDENGKATRGYAPINNGYVYRVTEKGYELVAIINEEGTIHWINKGGTNEG